MDKLQWWIIRNYLYNYNQLHLSFSIKFISKSSYFRLLTFVHQLPYNIYTPKRPPFSADLFLRILYMIFMRSFTLLLWSSYYSVGAYPVRFCLFSGCHMNIDLCCLYGRMPQYPLYTAYVHSFLNQICCKWMSEHMRRDISFYSSLSGIFF